MNTAISIRLPKELLNQMDHVADATERPRSFHVIKAIQNYLDEFADLQIALDRLQDPTDKVVSSKEFRKTIKDIYQLAGLGRASKKK